MNYYQHHIGDYLVETSHLTFLEDAAYSRLLRMYYYREYPYPADVAVVQRLSGARSKAEKNAVAVVLAEFFTLQDDGWHHAQADEQIAKYHSNKETSQENGKKGGRPKTKGEPGDKPDETKGKPDENPTETQTKPKPNPTLTQSKANQQPITNNQQPINTLSPPLRIETAPPDAAPTACVDPPGGLPAEPDKPPPEMPYGDGRPAGRLAKLLREQGVQVTPANPDFRSWVQAGLDADEIIAAVQIARTAKPKPEPIPWGYLSKVMTSQRNATPRGGITAKPKSDAHWALELAA